MDAIVQKAVKDSMAATRSQDSLPWKADQPHPQQIHSFDKSTQEWRALDSCDADSSSSSPSTDGTGDEVTHLAVLAWNIDFMLPYARSRMTAGLAELHRQIAALRARSPTTGVAVFLQECVASDLHTIATTPWVRDGFRLADRDSEHWGNSLYGTTTLVDRRLGVRGCFRVHYAASRMDRDGLFVDVVVPGHQKEKVVRLCNSHLESLALEPPYRPIQVGVMARFMKEDGLHGAIAAGDFNAIQPFDRSLHADNGLTDAYLALGGAEDSDEGYTWGQQAATNLRERFGCSRMDKVYLTSGGGGLELESFARFGADVEVDDPEERKKFVVLGFEKGWITDHLGIMAVVKVV